MYKFVIAGWLNLEKIFIGPTRDKSVIAVDEGFYMVTID